MMTFFLHKNQIMKSILTLSFLVMLVSCKKETVIEPVPSLPAMNYVDYHDQQIKFNQGFAMDINGDGIRDIYFYTQLVGDPILKRDYRQYLLTSSIATSMPFNDKEQIPVLEKESSISLTAHPRYEWYNASEVMLAQKVIEESAQDWWDGEWKNASHRYVAVQVNKNNLLYYGWIEISFDTKSEVIILHKSAISKEAGKAIKAGL